MKISNALLLILAIIMTLTGCVGENVITPVQIDDGYPIDILPIYPNSTIYSYENKDKEVDIKFGTIDEIYELKQYYSEYFENTNFDIKFQDMAEEEYYVCAQSGEYLFLLQVTKPSLKQDKENFKTIVRIDINIVSDEVQDLEIITASAIPTPTIMSTPSPTATNSPTSSPSPTQTIAPTPSSNIDNEELILSSTLDVKEASIFIACYGAISQDFDDMNLEDGYKYVDVYLMMINYGVNETGFYNADSFTLVDNDDKEYNSISAEGIYGAGVSLLGGGDVFDYIRFMIPESSKASSILAKQGIGKYVNEKLDIQIYSDIIDDVTKYSGVTDIVTPYNFPTFTQESVYIVVDLLSVKLVSTQVLDYDSVFGNNKNNAYSFEIELSNLTDEDIRFGEIYDFYLYDSSHNALYQRSVSLIEHDGDEFFMQPTAGGDSGIYRLSFEMYNSFDRNTLYLLMSDKRQQQNEVLFISLG